MEEKFLKSSQRIFLICASITLAILLFLMRGWSSSSGSIEKLAKQSLDPDIALTNNKPTIIEFYADWCEVCKEIAPNMVLLEKEFRESMDFVFLNIDNPSWEELIASYEINGIPYLTFFDKKGMIINKFAGKQTYDQLREAANSLLKGTEISPENNLGYFSNIKANRITEIPISHVKDSIGPRSHGLN
tara:strand:- start:3264 stop:3827 length:564 start_codon:yes stop_codon:yes gene_type:complete